MYPVVYKIVYCIVEQTLTNFSPFFQGPKFFISLDNEINKTLNCFSHLKKILKIELLTKYGNQS